MITRPPSQDPPDDADELYRRASALDTSRPGESVRRAVLAHAARLSATREPRRERSLKLNPAARRAHWRGALFGGLAAAALAALVIAPRIFAPGMPKVSAPPRAGLELQGTLSAGAPPPAGVQPVPASAPPAAFVAEQAPTDAIRTQSARQQARAAVASSAAKSADSSLAVAPAAPSAQQAQAYAAAPAVPAALAGRDARQTAEAFRRAAAAGDLSALTALRPEQSDINARDPSGRTALMLATVNGQAAAVLALLDYGADPNVADGRGVTPLEAAREADQPSIVAALLRHGAR